MDDDEQRPAKKYPISISKLSKTPSWIMLGFVLGALFVIALPPIGDDKAPPPSPVPAEPPKPAIPAVPQVTEIQAVFEDPRWEGFAVWTNDVTEVALWNRDTREFSDFFEVRRLAGANYYRSIPALTWRIMNSKNLPQECPLRFGAPKEMFPDASQRAPVERAWKPQPQPMPATKLPSVEMPKQPAPTLPKIEMQPGAPPSPSGK
jgi:hypothetical protein